MLFPVPFPSCEPLGAICNMKFPFGAGKFPVCRFLGNVAGDRVVGETLACVIPVCPQPGVRHLHPILPSEFSPISLCWETATPVWRGNCKVKMLGFIYFCASPTHPCSYPMEMEQCGCSEEGGWFILASFTDLTTSILWGVAAMGKQDLLGVSETPRGFCTG